MFTAQINTKNTVKVEPSPNKGSWLVNGQELQLDIENIGNGRMHVLLNNKSYVAFVVSADKKTKTFVLKINNQNFKVVLKDKYDDLLHKLGMDSAFDSKMNDLKAPMPGLVVDVFVNSGQAIKKGDALLVLEAMKMENVLKSLADGMVKKVEVKKGSKVEKNEVLVHFE